MKTLKIITAALLITAVGSTFVPVPSVATSAVDQSANFEYEYTNLAHEYVYGELYYNHTWLVPSSVVLEYLKSWYMEYGDVKPHYYSNFWQKSLSDVSPEFFYDKDGNAYSFSDVCNSRISPKLAEALDVNNTEKISVCFNFFAEHIGSYYDTAKEQALEKVIAEYTGTLDNDIIAEHSKTLTDRDIIYSIVQNDLTLMVLRQRMPNLLSDAKIEEIQNFEFETYNKILAELENNRAKNARQNMLDDFAELGVNPDDIVDIIFDRIYAELTSAQILSVVRSWRIEKVKTKAEIDEQDEQEVTVVTIFDLDSPPLPTPEPQPILGNFNSSWDGKTDASDLVYGRRAVAGWAGYEIRLGDGDINGNGAFDAQDVVYLARALAGWKGYKDIINK